MRSKAYAATSALLLVLAVQSSGFAQQNVVGYNRITVPASSDAFVCVPFAQPIEGSFVVSATDASSVSVAGTPFVAAKYNKTTGSAADYAYYVRFTSGNAAGLWMSIESNTTSQIVLDATVVSARITLLNLVAVGDAFRIYKHHTLSSLLPQAMYAHADGTNDLTSVQVLIYLNRVGDAVQNKQPTKTATFTTSGGGRWTGSGVASTTSLKPETQFIIRNNSSTNPFTVFTMGNAPDFTVAMLLAATGDLNIGTGYPVSLSLQTSGLGGVSGRQVLLFSNTTSGENKQPAKVATYSTSGGGRWTGSGVANPETLLPSQALTLRPTATDSGKITIPKPY